MPLTIRAGDFDRDPGQGKRLLTIMFSNAIFSIIFTERDC